MGYVVRTDKERPTRQHLFPRVCDSQLEEMIPAPCRTKGCPGQAMLRNGQASFCSRCYAKVCVSLADHMADMFLAQITGDLRYQLDRLIATMHEACQNGSWYQAKHSAQSVEMIIRGTDVHKNNRSGRRRRTG